MSNVLKATKQEQIVALGRLGWSLRRIERETGIRRETVSGYLKAAGVSVRSPGAWGHGSAQAPPNAAIDSIIAAQAPPNPAIDLIMEASGVSNAAIDSITDGVGTSPFSKPANDSITDPVRHLSACEPYRELIESRVHAGCTAMSIFQELVEDHGFDRRYSSVGRFVKKLRGGCRGEGHPVIFTAPGEEGQVDYGDGPMVRDPHSVRPHLVVALSELAQTLSSVGGIIVELPINLFALECAVKSFEKTQLSGRSIANSHVREIIFDIICEFFGNERGAVVGNKKRFLRQWTMQSLGFFLGKSHRLCYLDGRVAWRGQHRDGPAELTYCSAPAACKLSGPVSGFVELA